MYVVHLFSFQRSDAPGSKPGSHPNRRVCLISYLIPEGPSRLFSRFFQDTVGPSGQAPAGQRVVLYSPGGIRQAFSEKKIKFHFQITKNIEFIDTFLLLKNYKN